MEDITIVRDTEDIDMADDDSAIDRLKKSASKRKGRGIIQIPAFYMFPSKYQNLLRRHK